MTMAIRALKVAKAEYEASFYAYEPHGGTAQAARELGVDEHRIIKTIVLKTSEGRVIIVLMHGDHEISTKALARVLGVKGIEPCSVEEAERNSGYFCGGTSPFGFRRPAPVYAQKSIFELDWIYINGGQRGFFVKIAPEVLHTVLRAQDVDVEQ